MTVAAYSTAVHGTNRYIAYSRAKSRAMYILCIVFTALIIIVLGCVIAYLVSLGYTSIDWAFFSLDPVPAGAAGFPGGMRNGIVGSAILIGLASLLGIPVGMLTGIYLSEYSSRSYLAKPVRFIADVLTGVPSIVVGILGYELLVVHVAHHYNGWAGALALAFIMVPLVARTTEEMLLLVPQSYREASVALGATKARTILRVVLPAAFGSVITGVMLAIARVAGETAPLLFTALGSQYLRTNPKDEFPSLTREIYDGAMSPYHELNRQAWAGVLILLALIFLLNVGVRLAVRSVGGAGQHRK